MRGWLGVALLGLLCATIPACARAGLDRYEFRRVIMGVDARISLFAPDESAAADIARAGFVRLGELDAVLSDYRRDSELNHLAGAPPGLPVPLGPDLENVLRASLRAAALTQGAFDPTIGPLVTIWRDVRRSRELPDGLELLVARRAVGACLIDLIPRPDPSSPAMAILRAPNMRLDLGGVGKGYAAAAARDAVRARGAPRCLVSLAGDVAAGDPPPGREGWEIGIGAGERRLGVVLLSNLSISTAGDTEQFTEIDGIRYAHIIDPRTGFPVENAPCVSVVSTDGAMADALDTGLVILGKRPVGQVLASLPEEPPCAAILFDPRSDEPPLVTGRVDLIRWKER